MLKADGFDDAVIGIGRRCGQPELIVYDYWRCCEVLMCQDEEMTLQDAQEYMEFNVVGAWVGPNTPLFVEIKSMKEIDKYAEDQII